LLFHRVYSFDLRGQGRSQGFPNHVNDFYHYVEDMNSIIAHIYATYNTTTLFVLGHNLGSIIALEHSLNATKDVQAKVKIHTSNKIL
jgi:lysophospholipase